MYVRTVHTKRDTLGYLPEPRKLLNARTAAESFLSVTKPFLTALGHLIRGHEYRPKQCLASIPQARLPLPLDGLIFLDSCIAY